MKRIFVIYTGGTICTKVEKGVMSTDKDAARALVKNFKEGNSPYKAQAEFIEGRYFGILSENMTCESWNSLIDYFIENYELLSSCDGVIVAHGTDTLAYSGALFSTLLKGFKAPVIFVSSNYSLSDARANGNYNFTSAVECIFNGITAGVYATYKNTDDGIMYLHKGENLLQCQIYSDNFYSKDMLDITTVDTDLLKDFACEADIYLPLILEFKDKKLTDCVLKIEPYVGLNYNMFSLDGVKAVFHSTYHSGTACVVKTSEIADYNVTSSILNFFERCASRGVPFYYSPSLVGGEVNVYASVPFIEEHCSHGERINILYGKTNELIYTRLLIAYALGMKKEEIISFLQL